MFSHLFILFVSLMSFLGDFHVSGCDMSCADKPVFTPSRLVVKHGDPTSATCSVCQSACEGTVFSLEHSVGKRETNGTTISWKTDNMTEWETKLMCFYTDNVTDVQCCSTLPVTIYKPPDSVSISTNNLSGPMFEGRQYSLLCTVHNVAPVKNLIVTFYKGKTQLGQTQSINNAQNKSVTEIYSLTITPSKEDDGAQYWCDAELELGPEGPQPPPVVMSQNISTTVYYKPHLEEASHPRLINITEGERLELDCSAVGNPRPSYTWTLPVNQSIWNSSIFIIDSVTSAHEGQYTCSVSNGMGLTTVTFHVVVKAKPLRKVSSRSENITATEGETLHLNCSSGGHSPTSYTWTPPLTNSSVLTIESAAFEHEMTYTCSATNVEEDFSVSFHVEVQANYIPYIVVAVLVFCVLVVTCVLVGCIRNYKHHRMGRYNLKDVFRLHIPLIPLSSP